MRTPSGTSSSSSSSVQMVGASAGALERMATVNIRRGLLGRRPAISNGGGPPPKRQRLSNSPIPGTSRGADQNGQPPRASTPMAQDSASSSGSGSDGPVVRARSNTYPGANAPNAPTPEVRPGALRRGWDSFTSFSDRQGDRVLGWTERHPIATAAVKSVGAGVGGVGTFLIAQKISEAINGGSKDSDYIKELQKQNAELADLNSAARGSLESLKEVVVTAVKTGEVPEAFVKEANSSSPGDTPQTGRELAILLKHFGEQIRHPEWRPDRKLMKQAPDLYRLALLAPYYVGLEREAEVRNDEKPTPLSPTTVKPDSDSWLDTAPLSAPNDPSSARLQTPNPVAERKPAEEEFDRKPLIFMCVVGLLTIIGGALYCCGNIKRRRPRDTHSAANSIEMQTNSK